MNIDKNSDVTIASIAKVRSKPDTGSTEESFEEPEETENIEETDDRGNTEEN